MQKMRIPLPLVSVVVYVLLAHAAAASAGEHRFHHDHVLGTSLDLTVWGTADESKQAERVILDEIERLRRILSTYDADSDVGRLNASALPLNAAPELIEVLRAYEQWQQRSGGAYCANLGELIAAWKLAQQTQKLPDDDALVAIATRAARPAWRIDGRTVTRLSSSKLNIDSLGKGYIITRAIEKAAQAVPAAEGVLLNIGGDIRIHNRSISPRACTIAISDPANPADNAPPLTLLSLTNGAISTSGSYERGYDIGGRHYSHILDPRTGRPAAAVASATVIAPDNITANALATTLCVLSPEEGLRLVKQTPGVHCLIVAADGRQFRSDGFVPLQAAAPAAAPPAPAAAAWPKDFQLSLTLTLKASTGRRKSNRPYVAIWVENERGQAVRTLTVWGNERKYLKDLPVWWAVAKNQPQLVQAVTRASRPAGRYKIVWDGLDDSGKPLPPGAYKIAVEANKEHGRHVIERASIDCRDNKASAVVKESVEWQEAQIIYSLKAEQQ